MLLQQLLLAAAVNFDFMVLYRILPGEQVLVNIVLCTVLEQRCEYYSICFMQVQLYQVSYKLVVQIVL